MNPRIIKNRISNRNSNYGFICIAGFTITFKSSLLEGIDSSLRPRDYFAPSDMVQSHDKWIPMLANSLGSILFLAEPLALYRRHSKSLSGEYGQQSAAQRIKKASSIGSQYYMFQNHAGIDAARSLVAVSSKVSSYRRDFLFVTSELYNFLAKISMMRSKLYSTKEFHKRIIIIALMIINRAYLGSRFYSLGLLALLKDLYFNLVRSSYAKI